MLLSVREALRNMEVHIRKRIASFPAFFSWGKCAHARLPEVEVMVKFSFHLHVTAYCAAVDPQAGSQHFFLSFRSPGAQEISSLTSLFSYNMSQQYRNLQLLSHDPPAQLGPLVVPMLGMLPDDYVAIGNNFLCPGIKAFKLSKYIFPWSSITTACGSFPIQYRN